MDLKMWKLALVIVLAGAVGGAAVFFASRDAAIAKSRSGSNPASSASGGSEPAATSTSLPTPADAPMTMTMAERQAAQAREAAPVPAPSPQTFQSQDRFPSELPGTAPSAAPSPDGPTAKGQLPTGSSEATTGDKGMGGEARVAVARPEGSAPGSPYHNVYVLSVGVNIALPGVGGRLQYAVDDAEAVAQAFRRRYGFERVTILRDQAATRDAIFGALDRIQAELARGEGADDFIFFFSGHGFTKAEAVQRDGRETTVRHGFLVPYETRLKGEAAVADWHARAIDMKDLTDRIIALPARHRLMFIDSCFSGLAFSEQTVIRRVPDEAYRDVMQRPTVQVFTAGLDTELALEDRSLGHGVFTHALLQQIEDSGIRTTEEIFLPLRATVRDEVARFPGASMTPQHRYLKHAEGTFVFVPRDRADQWADSRPDDAAFLAAGQKGYFEPVREEEVQEINEVAARSAEQPDLQSDPAWQERIDRYEARAAMGDPYAMTALARMYDAGLGAEPDEDRSKLWAEESREMFQFSASLGIRDPEMAKLVDSILNNDELIAAAVGEEKVEETKKNLQKVAELFQKLRGMFGGDGGKATVDAIDKQRLSIVRDLQDPGRNRNARDRLNRMEENFRTLAAEYGDDAKPREFDQIAGLMTRARENIEFGVQRPAIRALEDVGELLDAIKAQAPEKPEK
jgi:hypothetical protein